MFGSKVVVFVLGCLFLFVGCAKPNYVNVKPVNSEKGTNPNSSQICDSFLPKAKICVSVRWNKTPTEDEYGSFVLSFFKLENPQINLDPGHDVQVILWMPKMGHGSSPVKLSKVSDGVYNVDDVYFIMPGQWQIRIQLKENQNVVDEIYQDYNY